MPELFNNSTSLLASSLLEAQRKVAESLKLAANATQACEQSVIDIKKSYEADMLAMSKALSEANNESEALRVKLDSEALKTSLLEAELASVAKERELDEIALNSQAETIARLSKEIELLKLLNSSKNALIVRNENFEQLKAELEEMTKERNALISFISAISERVRVGSFKFPISHKMEILNNFFRSVRK